MIRYTDTVGPCCWDSYRASIGLAPKPFPNHPVVPSEFVRRCCVCKATLDQESAPQRGL